jgi:hypothetical protein
MATALTTSANMKSDMSVPSTVNYVKDLFKNKAQGMSGVEVGISSILSKTALKGLPAPLNVVVPLAAELVILRYAIPGGRNLLLKGLKWIKKATDEQPQ